MRPLHDRGAICCGGGGGMCACTSKFSRAESSPATNSESFALQNQDPNQYHFQWSMDLQHSPESVLALIELCLSFTARSLQHRICNSAYEIVRGYVGALDIHVTGFNLQGWMRESSSAAQHWCWILGVLGSVQYVSWRTNVQHETTKLLY